MKKIIMALDPEKWNRDTVDIACYLTKISRSKLNAVFLKLHEDMENVPFSTNHAENETQLQC